MGTILGVLPMFDELLQNKNFVYMTWMPHFSKMSENKEKIVQHLSEKYGHLSKTDL
jgi:hypothetical protein